jgi:hypothetical protein
MMTGFNKHYFLYWIFPPKAGDAFNKHLMKKKIFCAAALLIVFSSGFAQQKINNRSLELNLGASIPIFKFASGESGNHIQGFAKTGQAITLSYYHPTKSKFGFMVMLFGQKNPLNISSLEDKYSNTPFYSLIFSPTPNPTPAPPIYYKNWEFNKESWYTASLMVGTYTLIPVNEVGKFSLTMKALIGAAYASSPQYLGTSRSDTATVQILQQANDGFGFSYSLIPGFRYLINQGTHITFNASYFGTAGINFNNMKTSGRIERSSGPTGTISSWTHTGDVDQSVQTIYLALGIQFDL